MTDAPINYRCPICLLALHKKDRSFICDNKHCFDIAKEGYINLLPVQHKKSKHPGDSADMIRARRHFLDAGYYSDFADFLIQHLDKTIHNLLDIGSGEGYYSSLFQNHLTKTGIYGLDISKPAVKMSAKKNHLGRYSVASAYQLPFFDACFDAITSIFSPINMQEAVRVLRPGAKLYFVGPGTQHLKSLAQRVYHESKPHEGSPTDNIPNHLELLNIEQYKNIITVNGKDLPKLLLMTPYYWSCSEDKKVQLAALPNLEVELDFELKIFRKNDL